MSARVFYQREQQQRKRLSIEPATNTECLAETTGAGAKATNIARATPLDHAVETYGWLEGADQNATGR